MLSVLQSIIFLAIHLHAFVKIITALSVIQESTLTNLCSSVFTLSAFVVVYIFDDKGVGRQCCCLKIPASSHHLSRLLLFHPKVRTDLAMPSTFYEAASELSILRLDRG